jgi:type II secretory pathway pseudopilin PulG
MEEYMKKKFLNLHTYQKGFIKGFFWLVIIILIGGYSGNWIYQNYFSQDKEKIQTAKNDMELITEQIALYFLENEKWPVSLSQLSNESKENLNLISPWQKEYFLKDSNVVCLINNNPAKKITIPFKNYNKWEYEYNATEDPTKSSPPWVKVGSGQINHHQGALVFKDEKKPGSLMLTQDISRFEPDHDYGLTFQTEVKVTRNSEADIFITLHDGTYYYTLCFYTDSIELRSGSRFLIENFKTKMTERTYLIRLCIGYEKISVFKDQELIILAPIEKLEGKTDKKLIILGADISGTKTAGGTFKDIKFTTQGAHF